MYDFEKGLILDSEIAITDKEELKVVKHICENCKYLNSQGHCPLFSMFHGYGWQLGYEVTCNKFKMMKNK